MMAIDAIAKSHKVKGHRYLSPADAFDVIVYTGSGLMGREVTNIHSEAYTTRHYRRPSTFSNDHVSTGG